jgi:hypothetical protein
MKIRDGEISDDDDARFSQYSGKFIPNFAKARGAILILRKSRKQELYNTALKKNLYGILSLP